ncbi:MAG: glycine cleavage system protein H, partial [Acidobacteriota bacterium]
VEVNEALEDHPELVNESPHKDGWLVRLRFEAGESFDELMDADAYAEFARGGE